MRKLSKKKEEEDKTKRKITEANQQWCDWKFQIHCNTLEWVNPKSRDEIKNPFCVSSKKKSFKDKNEPAHWVGRSKLRSLDIDELFKRTQKFDEKEAGVTGNTEEEKYSLKTTDNADKNAE